MLAMVPFYARTCRPQDEIAAQIAMEHRLYYYGDLHVFGEYPSFMKAFQKERGIVLDITKEDLQYLKEGCVDYIGISYYMSSTISSIETDDSIKVAEGFYVARNPYVEKSDWNWQIDPQGLRSSASKIS